MRYLPLLLAFLLLPACTPVDPHYDALSLDGAMLVSPPPDPAKLPALNDKRAAAEAAWQQSPTEQAAIDRGRAAAALGHYRLAIDDFTYGLDRFPDSHRLLRHRGHRYLTVHKIPKAVADLSRAWDLAQRVPDARESVDGRSTDRSAILYHLGLAHYLNGDFAAADRVFAQRSTLPSLNDDNLVSTTYWHYWSLRRLNRGTEATALLAPIREGMDIQDNKSYYTLCKMYKGLTIPAEVESAITEKGKLNPGLAYGLALWKRYELDDPAASDALLRRITADDNWTAFGHLAAEADLASR